MIYCSWFFFFFPPWPGGYGLATRWASKKYPSQSMPGNSCPSLTDWKLVTHTSPPGSRAGVILSLTYTGYKISTERGILHFPQVVKEVKNWSLLASLVPQMVFSGVIKVPVKLMPGLRIVFWDKQNKTFSKDGCFFIFVLAKTNTSLSFKHAL